MFSKNKSSNELYVCFINFEPKNINCINYIKAAMKEL